MPFDSTGFPPPAPRKTPRPSDDTAATLIIVVSAAVLLLTPISAAALVDIVHYVQHWRVGTVAPSRVATAAAR